MARLRLTGEGAHPPLVVELIEPVLVKVGVRVLKPYGFVDEFGDRWHWIPGQVVRNPWVISMLADRIAPTEDVME